MRQMTIEEFNTVSERERRDFVNKHIETEQKKLMGEGIYPHTLSWVLGKTVILYDLAHRYNIRWDFVPEQRWTDRLRVGFIEFLIKSRIIQNMTMVKLIDKVMKMPRMMFPRWVYEMDGLKLQMDEGDIEMRPILKDYQLLKIWEPETTKIVKENVKEGDTCIDIGGSIGIFTLQFARLVGKAGKVFTFEPTEMNYDYQQQNVRLNGFEDRCVGFKMGAWGSWEVLPLPRCAAKPFWTNGVPVADFLEKNFGITKVDFIKIDVDGSEPEVLRGLIPIFENNKQLKIVCEFYPKYIKDAGLNPEDMKEIINKYFTYTVIPGDYSGNCENWYCVHK